MISPTKAGTAGRFVVLLLAMAAVASAQVDWYGYYEAEGDYLQLPSGGLYFGSNKLRVDLEANPSGHIRVGADVVYKTYDGQTRLNFIEFLPKSHWPVLPTGDTLTYFELTFRDTLFLDNVYLEFHHPRFDLTLGRQQISPGVGYAWNPTDIFNVKDILDPTYEQTGVRAVRLGIPLGGALGLTGIIQPGPSWRDSPQFYQAKANLGRFDLAIVYGFQRWTQTGLLAAVTQTRDMGGFTLEGELIGMGVHAELAANQLDYASDNLFYEYVLGLDYTFESSLYLLAEYLHNDFGTAPDAITFDDYLTYFMGERHSLGRDYLFGLAMYPITDVLVGQLFAIINLEDRSAVFNPQVDYSVYENVDLSITTSIFFGEEEDEFGNQDLGVRVRLKAYF